MKLKPILMSIGATLIILTPLWLSHLIWWFRPTIPLDLLVVDYTVLPEDFSHHEGLFWLLNHLRVDAPKGANKWRTDEHYTGHKPSLGEAGFTRIEQIDLSPFGLVYVADTYGVYDTDMNPSKPTSPPGLVFGGLSPGDVASLSRYADPGGDVVLEFNTFCGPTNEAVRQAAESLMGVRWTGWAGRFFEDLQDRESLPTWLPKLYRNKYGTNDLPMGHGFMLIHDSGRFLLLAGERFESSMPLVRVTAAGKTRFAGSYPIPPYFGWFAIVRPAPDAKILAEIILPTPSAWADEYREEAIPVVFPLLTELKKGESSRFYFSANIANLNNPPDVYRMAGLPGLQAAVHRRRDQFSEMPAYWQIYVPLMGKIIKETAY